MEETNLIPPKLGLFQILETREATPTNRSPGDATTKRSMLGQGPGAEKAIWGKQEIQGERAESVDFY